MSRFKAAVTPVVVLAVVTMSAGLAAGHGGGGGGGHGGGYGGGHGGYGGYGHGYGGYGGYGRGYGGYGYGGYGFGGFGYGLGLGLGLGLYPGNGYGYYGYPGYGYGYGGGYALPAVVPPVILPPDPLLLGSAAPAAVPVQGQAVAAAPAPPAPTLANKARIQVIVPEDAVLWFEGVATTLTGTSRVFNSPELPTDKTYVYEVKARWMQSGQPIERTLTVKVQRNKTSVADFHALPPPKE